MSRHSLLMAILFIDLTLDTNSRPLAARWREVCFAPIRPSPIANFNASRAEFNLAGSRRNRYVG
jgi:hypothetical protein